LETAPLDTMSPRVSITGIIRRTELPVPAQSMENISIMGILRNNVGKDLSTVAMPIALNEPINLLQKMCEELEYSSLLDDAANIVDPVDRLAVVAAFVVSAYSSTIHRAARKPFNPLLGETFEFNRPDRGFKFISEKVSHHPPIMACHAESSKYTFYQDSLLKTKFWGKSMELSSIGTAHIIFKELNEHYVYNKVTTSMRNIFSSGRYLEHHGTLKITSKTTGHYCELNFKESGYFASSGNEVVGGIFCKQGKKQLSIRF
jgi:oxysterol-binding protein-related protein 3/6/7